MFTIFRIFTPVSLTMVTLCLTRTDWTPSDRISSTLT